MVYVALPFSSNGISSSLPFTMTVTLPVAPGMLTVITVSLPNWASDTVMFTSDSNLATLNTVLFSLSPNLVISDDVKVAVTV